MKTKLSFEQLESRENPSSVLQNGGQLLIVGDLNKPNVVVLDNVNSGDLRVQLNGTQQTFQNVTQVTVLGGNKNDDISNNTAISSTIVAMGGNDTVFGGAGNDIIDAGKGKDVVYDLLGVNVINSQDNQADRVYTNAQSTVMSDNKDQVVSFFAAGRTPGAGSVSLENGVLYITPTNNGSSVQLDEVGNKIFLSFNFNDGNGPQVLSFNKKDVKVIAYFGGTGNDTYVNNTKIEEAAYGSAGNDVIVGGFGDFNLLKGSGGNDVLVARGKRADMSGNGGTDFLFGNKGRTVFRVDALDYLFSLENKDLVVLS